MSIQRPKNGKDKTHVSLQFLSPCDKVPRRGRKKMKEKKKERKKERKREGERERERERERQREKEGPETKTPNGLNFYHEVNFTRVVW